MPRGPSSTKASRCGALDTHRVESGHSPGILAVSTLTGERHEYPATRRAGTPAGRFAPLLRSVDVVHARFQPIPHSLIACVARIFSAAVFWNSGQTKVQGFGLNLVGGDFPFGWPRLSDPVPALFEDGYTLPLLSPAVAAPLAALAEHLLPLLLLVGLATRKTAFGLLLTPLVIPLFVFPGACATHGTWAALLLYLMLGGAGRFSLDHAIEQRLRLRLRLRLHPRAGAAAAPQRGPATACAGV